MLTRPGMAQIGPGLFSRIALARCGGAPDGRAEATLLRSARRPRPPEPGDYPIPAAPVARPCGAIGDQSARLRGELGQLHLNPEHAQNASNCVGCAVSHVTDLLLETSVGAMVSRLSNKMQLPCGVNLVGPTRHDTRWQARQDDNRFTAQDFKLDYELQQAICPAGKTRQLWTPAIDIRGNPMIQIKFAQCACPVQLQCTCANPPRRTVTVHPEAQQSPASRPSTRRNRSLRQTVCLARWHRRDALQWRAQL